ncbi:MAG: DUF3108 domain-containing protein [Sulfuricellaceae bacterium]
MVKNFITVFLFLLAMPVWAAPPQATTATYRLTKLGQSFGTARETFKRDANRYRIESVSSAVGIFALFAKGKIRLISTGEVTADGLRPQHFEHHRGDDPAKRIVADFDWEKHSATHRFDGKSESADLPADTQDRISLLYQFMFHPPQGTGIELAMSNGRQLNRYQYKVIGEETIVTPAGRFETIHLSKRVGEQRDGAEVWLAKERHYFPVRIAVDEKDGGTLEQELTSLEITE